MFLFVKKASTYSKTIEKITDERGEPVLDVDGHTQPTRRNWLTPREGPVFMKSLDFRWIQQVGVIGVLTSESRPTHDAVAAHCAWHWVWPTVPLKMPPPEFVLFIELQVGVQPGGTSILIDIQSSHI